MLILNVSDLWPSAGFELGALKKDVAYGILERIERSNYHKANLILGQSDEILTHIHRLLQNKPTHLYRNYPNFKPPKITINADNSAKIKMVYAGLLGVAQGVLRLCQELDYTTIEFHIYGAGAEHIAIENYLKMNPELPIFYHGEVPREALHKALLKYDLGIIPLSNRIYGSVPSKLFEYARLGLPILYFGGGEGETLILEHQLGWIANAGNYQDLNSTLHTIKKSNFKIHLSESIRATAKTHFDFDTQLDALLRHL
jgi:hypothetical protein